MPVDELSQTLGRLEAGFEELTRQCRSLFTKGDESAAQLHRLSVTVEQLAGAMRDMKTEVAELRRARERGVGFLACLTLLGGGVGAGAVKLLSLFGGSTPGH